MVNYNNGKIYKIEDLNGEMCYIGSTTKEYLSQRMTEHRQKYASWKKANSDKFTVYDIFDKHGVSNCHIVLIEVCPCSSRDELTSREAHYIRTVECVNKVILDRGGVEYRKDYYIKHLEAKKQYAVDYRTMNASKIKEYKTQTEACVYGTTHIRDGKARHLRSKKHTDYMATHHTDISFNSHIIFIS